ncbi:MAG: M20/M25/M40 family metallo-hydrolase [Patescibacteria group bacterium]
MNYRLLRYFGGIVFFVFVVSTVASGQVHHDLKVLLQPDSHRIEVVDMITLPKKVDAWPIIFALHKGLNPRVLSKDMVLKKTGVEEGLEVFEITLPLGISQFTIAYEGKIFHPIDENREEYARGFSATSGIISSQGVFLAGSSIWYPYFYPYFTDRLVTFNMEIKLPVGWQSVSQGARTEHRAGIDGQLDRWVIDKPQEEIYLIAAKFTEYSQFAGNVSAMVFLRNPDNELAKKYLDATAQYLEMYSKLLGVYPYDKFALVENFWETGYGMPSFTILGSSIIRFPFILNSSFPHEILHNWWGNGVFVDCAKGNWCEGLTAYLADYFLKEQSGEGAEHRRLILQKYKNYATSGVGKDFPISKFTGRHSGATEAIGYGKTAMFFHMLRREVGDKIFFDALRQFYREYKFKPASFDDIESVFSKINGRSLKWIFEQWIEWTGAPSLKTQDVIVKKEGEKYVLSAIIEQTQNTIPYRLKVPLVVYMKGVTDPYRMDIDIYGREFQLEIILPAQPIHLNIDPDFEIFRILDRNETPPAMSLMFGAEKISAVLPADAPKLVRSAYSELAKSWRVDEIRFDNELSELPNDRAVWVFGWENKFRPDISKALSCYDFVDDQDVCINGVKLQRNQHSVAVMARNPVNNDYALGWLATDSVSAISGLGRKLPHYNRYGYLGFTGDEPINALKGQWPIVNSPLSILLENARDSTPYIKNCIKYLASKELEGRGLGTMGIDKAAGFIAVQFRRIGLMPAGDNESYFQAFQYVDEKSRNSYPVKNIIGIIRGKNDKENIVIGAHYDHLGRGEFGVKEEKYKGQIHPGANDNASGVAVLLEVARSLKSQNFQPERNIIFVAFSGEEAGKIGSKYYAMHMNRGEKCVGMINIDTVGQIKDNKILVIGAQSAKEWKELLERASLVSLLKVDFIPMDLDSSDQKSFHEAGIPAIQLLSGIDLNYHRPSDTLDQINFAGLNEVVKFTEEAVRELTKRNLTVIINVEEIRSKKPQEKIKVNFGTIPDFTYQGIGYRLAGVKPESPAALAGLQAEDVITKINDADIEDLRGFAETLRVLNIGDKISITFLRNGEKYETEAVLK